MSSTNDGEPSHHHRLCDPVCVYKVGSVVLSLTTHCCVNLLLLLSPFSPVNEYSTNQNIIHSFFLPPSINYLQIITQMKIKGVNHFGHFLLVNLLLDDMSRAKNARVCIVGSITGNTNTVGGGLVYPRADLGKLQGFEKGAREPIAMVDGKPFFGAKAYKDSKVCNMMTVSQLHNRYHESTGIIFSSMYPGCIAETNLFREKRPWFRKAFPWFMKYVTGGYVGEEEAGQRLAQVIDDPNCGKSNVYWSWNGGAQTVGRWSEDGKPRGAGGSGGEIFENSQSDAVRDSETACKMWDLSVEAVGLSEKEMFQGK